MLANALRATSRRTLSLSPCLTGHRSAPACPRSLLSAHFASRTQQQWTRSLSSAGPSSPPPASTKTAAASYTSVHTPKSAPVTFSVHTSTSAPASSAAHALPPPSADSAPSSQQIQLERRVSITFTCTVEDCEERSTHEFSRRSYERGIVIVQCPGCKNRHLIADHLGWFKDVTAEGQHRTIEDLMHAKGETVRRGHIDGDGTVVEYAPES